jgi:hypothetical protein
LDISNSGFTFVLCLSLVLVLIVVDYKYTGRLQVIIMHTPVWLHKLFHEHMKTKSALIPEFSADDVTHVTNNTQPTIALAPIPQTMTCTTALRIFNPPPPSVSEESDDDDGTPVPPPTPHTPFDMNDTIAPLGHHLPHDLHNLATFYSPKPGDQGNIALLTHSNYIHEDEVLAYPYKEPGADIEIISDDVEFCNSHLPEYDSNPQSDAQALLSKKSKYWCKAIITLDWCSKSIGYIKSYNE